MDVLKAGVAEPRRGPAEWFTGTVFIDPIVSAPAPARVQAAAVRFEPGARTAWHTHPLGQTLRVVSGSGLVQSWGEEARIIEPGDSVWIPPGEKHWHGAAPDSSMTHVAIQEQLDGNAVEWLEHVTDRQYAAAAEEAG